MMRKIREFFENEIRKTELSWDIDEPYCLEFSYMTYKILGEIGFRCKLIKKINGDHIVVYLINEDMILDLTSGQFGIEPYYCKSKDSPIKFDIKYSDVERENDFILWEERLTDYEKNIINKIIQKGIIKLSGLKNE